MNDLAASLAFGQADLTNCERELIHLAGSIQPHGYLFVIDASMLAVCKASNNAAALLGIEQADLVGLALSRLGGDVVCRVQRLLDENRLEEPQPVRCRLAVIGRVHPAPFEGTLHRLDHGRVVLELEPVAALDGDATFADRAPDKLRRQLAAVIDTFSATTSINALCDAVVDALRPMVGYDRVMVYKFDPDGHGEIIAEARKASLDSLLGHHYPATDIPQRARALYVRTRVRVLVDVNYEPVPIEPDAAQLDMSLCHLRSMSPLHLQYLKNMGVTATLVVSLVRDGQLWGLIACHHYSPRKVSYRMRAACGLLAEVISTRIAAIENYEHAQGVIVVRALEQRLIEATSSHGDWRRALFSNPRTLLQPLNSSGAALFFEGDVLTVGDVPSTPELRALSDWVQARATDSEYVSASVVRENPALASLAPTASGVVAIGLSSSRPDYLMWFRHEQVSEVTWAGDPTKAVIDNDPMNLSPRRSFAAWSQIVRGSALPWSNAEVALARAIGTTLIDIIVQIQAVRLLIAQHQLNLVRDTVENSKEPVVIADADGRILFSNGHLATLLGASSTTYATLDELAGAFVEVAQARAMLDALRERRRSWRGELGIVGSAMEPVPVGVRADMVFGAQGSTLGFILIFADLTENKRAAAARGQLEAALLLASKADSGGADSRGAFDAHDEVIGAIMTNARLAALDIADSFSGGAVAPLIEELKSATQRAASIYAQMRMHGPAGDRADDTTSDHVNGAKS